MLKLLSPILKVVDRVLDSVLPDNMSEGEKATTKMAAQRLTFELAAAEKEEFHNFILDYEGRAKDMPQVIQIVRALIRPGITIAVCVLMFHHVWYMIPIPQLLYVAVLLTFGFWFGERAISNVAGVIDLKSIVTKKTGQPSSSA